MFLQGTKALTRTPRTDRFCRVVQVAYGYAFAGHIALGIIFLCLGVLPLVWFNFLFSVPVFLLAFFINKKGFHNAAFLLACCELLSHQYLTVHMLGWKSGFQYVLLYMATLPFFNTYWKKTSRFLVGAVAPIAFCMLYLYCRDSSVYVLKEYQYHMLFIGSTLSTFISLMLMVNYFVQDANKSEKKLNKSVEKLNHLNGELITATFRLARSEEKYRRILETTEEGFILGSKSTGIVDVNDAILRMVGAPREDVVGKKPFEFMNDSFAAFVRKNWDRVVKGELTCFEGQLRNVDGSETPVQIHANMLTGDDGKDLGYVAFIVDLTEAKKAEKMRDDIDHITRHDLKSPLNGIISIPEFMLQYSNLNDGDRKMLQKIEEAGYRMLNMINLSLDLYKMEQGKYEYFPSPVDLVKQVNRVLSDNRNLASLKKLNFHLCDDSGNQPTAFIVQGEELLCYSMLANCIKNAMEASPQNGTVLISFHNSPLKISVHNQGVVPEAIRDVFFDKFTTSGKSGGTGLGTYSAKLIAETLGGTIAMQTSADAGTTVSVTFE
ncbi:PAS domain-containing sensor histidine kinase [Maridesulfovibrio sp.]|uniref:PAS domain-containing sensor histidine kinase n=1 Tax=Maridesulfovibrio sp. TaxID=2795000 RepID=UPI0029C9E8AD|nr:PAS domain-containing sensor histidine kinase [Maridesulfovibrio sp.]